MRNSRAPVPDAAFLVNAEVKNFRLSDLTTLRAKLEEGRMHRRRIVVIESVSALTGRTAPLAEILALTKLFNADLVVDESSAIGGCGLRGAGASDTIPLRDVMAIVVDLGLGLASFGAAVVGSQTLIRYLLQRSRTFIGETPLPAAIAAAAESGLDLIELRSAARERLALLALRLRSGLKSLRLIDDEFGESPIIGIPFSKSSTADSFARALFERNFYVEVVAVPLPLNEGAIVRILLNSAHSDQTVSGLLDACTVASRLA